MGKTRQKVTTTVTVTLFLLMLFSYNTFSPSPKAHATSPIQLNTSDSLVQLQTGAESYQFTKDSSGTWGVDSVLVNNLQVARPNHDSLSLHAPATADASNNCCPPSAATDNDPNTYWQGGHYPTSLAVDLRGTLTFNKVVLRLPVNWSRRTQTLTISASPDNSTWSDIASGTYTFDPNTGNAATITFASSTARYVRATFTGNSGAASGQVGSFDVYNDASVADTIVGVTASSQNNCCLVGNSIDSAGANTYWEGGNFPASLTADLGTATSINKAVIALPSSWSRRTQTFTVATSTDNTNWTNAVSGTYTFDPNSANTAIVPFATVSARYLRLTFTANSGAVSGQIGNLAIYTDTSSSGGFFSGSGRASSYTILANDANSCSIRFDGNNGNPWSVTYTVNASDRLPMYTVNISGPTQAQVLYYTPTADPAEQGGWITRGVLATDSQFTQAFIDTTNPLVFGHSKAGSVDSSYVFLPVVNTHAQGNGKTEEHSGTNFESGRASIQGGGYYGYWGLDMAVGGSEPTQYRVVFDQGLDRIHGVAEKYYANAVDTIGNVDNISIDSRIGDVSMNNVPVRLFNPEGFTPGYGWRMQEIGGGGDPANYPWTTSNSVLQGRTLYYEGLATGRAWEQNFGKYLVDNSPVGPSTDHSTYFVTESRGQCYQYGGKSYNGMLGAAAHDDLWGFLRNVYYYGKVANDSNMVNLAVGAMKYDMDAKLDLTNMFYHDSWNCLTETGSNTVTNYGTALLAMIPIWGITAAQETGDTSYYNKADQVIDFFTNYIWSETKFDYFNTNMSTWAEVAPGDFFLALVNKYQRSGDQKYLEVAKDVAWIPLMWLGTAHFPGLSEGNRGTPDYDSAPNLCFEQSDAILRMAGVLFDIVSSPSYTKAYELAYHQVAADTWPSAFNVDLSGTVLRTFYDTDVRELTNLMYGLDKSSDSKVIAIEKLVAKSDPNITHQRDIFIANGTHTDRTTTLAVRYLQPGTYSVAIDGAYQSTMSDTDLASGLNMTLPANTLHEIQVNAVSLTPVTPPTLNYDGSTTYLSDLADAGSTRLGGGTTTYVKNQSYGGHTLSIGGTTYSKGLGMGDSTAVVYNLNGQYQTFATTIGVDDEVSGATAPAPTVNYTIFVDGVLKYDSGKITPASGAQNVTIDVTHAKVIVLRLSNNWDDPNDGPNDHGDWVNARLIGKAS